MSKIFKLSSLSLSLSLSLLKSARITAFILFLSCTVCFTSCFDGGGGGGGGDDDDNKATLTLDHTTLTMDSNSTATISATAETSDGEEDTITAESSDSDIASVSVDGLKVTVTGIKAGTTTVTVTSNSEIEKTCEVTVTASWKTVFLDNFDGSSLDTDNLTQCNTAPAPYSLTGSGELEIEGESLSDQDGAKFKYNTNLSSSHHKTSLKLRVTMTDPVEEDLEFGFWQNFDDNTDSGYCLVMSSDEVSGTRDYIFKIYKITNGTETILEEKSIEGTKPQIQNNTSLIIESIYNNGTITFNIKDSSGSLIDSIEAADSTYTSGYTGFCR